MFRRILFAHNATPAAERALIYLEHMARSEGASIIVLHVYQPPDRYTAMAGHGALVEQFEQVAYEVVNDTVEYLQKAGISAVGIVVAFLEHELTMSSELVKSAMRMECGIRIGSLESLQ